MKTGIIAVTNEGRKLAKKIAVGLEDAHLLSVQTTVQNVLQCNWNSYDGFICIMATGIVVRSIATLLKDKGKDPCVVVADQRGDYVVSLLSGHLGGGNHLTNKLASLIGAQPVITTASDILNLTPLDLWVQTQNLVVCSRKEMTRASARLVNKGCLHIYSEVGVESLPSDLLPVDNLADADIVVSNRIIKDQQMLVLHPRNLVVGIGCNRNTSAEDMEKALTQFLAAEEYAYASVRNLASIDLKQDEQGLLEFAAKNNWNIDFFTKDALNNINGVSTSLAVLKAVGAKGVAEPAALLSAEIDRLLVEKKKWPNVTLALAQANFMLSAQVQGA